MLESLPKQQPIPDFKTAVGVAEKFRNPRDFNFTHLLPHRTDPGLLGLLFDPEKHVISYFRLIARARRALCAISCYQTINITMRCLMITLN
jgi:hypothetical protein